MDTVAAYAESFGVYDKLQPFLANAWAPRKPRCSRWLPPMRCLPMAASAWNRRWWTACRIATAAPFIVTTNAICEDCADVACRMV